MNIDTIAFTNEYLTRILTIFFIFLIIFEAIFIVFYNKSKYNFYDSAGSFGVAIGNMVLKPFTRGILLAIFTFTQKFAFASFPIDNIWVWVFGFFLVEFVYYWQHRFFHEIRYMWLSHMVHHSSNTFTLPSAIRLSWFSLASFSWVLFLPLVIIGFPPIMIALLMSVNLGYQFLLHTKYLGAWKHFGLIFNTPAHHEIHHASNEPYLDKNFGGILIIYDKLFGTFASLKPDTEPKYGLTKPINSNNPFIIVLGGWIEFFKDCKNSKSFNELAHNIFGKPK